jgi:hypothetical protein
MEHIDQDLELIGDRVTGFLEVGVSDANEVVINLDHERTGHITFSPPQARNLAGILLAKASEATAIMPPREYSHREKDGVIEIYAIVTCGLKGRQELKCAEMGDMEHRNLWIRFESHGGGGRAGLRACEFICAYIRKNWPELL